MHGGKLVEVRALYFIVCYIFGSSEGEIDVFLLSAARCKKRSVEN
jgi:hypothetical protein